MSTTVDGNGLGTLMESPRWRAPNARPLRATIAFITLGVLTFLVVPYFLPVRRALSDSYCVGFSNQGAVLLWIFFSLAFGYWHGPFQVARTAKTDRQGDSYRPLWAVLAVSTGLHVAAWLCCLRFGPLGEATYLVDRLQHLALGQRVFRDFEMAYGAGMLYVPLWLSRGLHLSLLSGYCLALLLEQAAGILMLWYVVRSVGRENPHRNSIFVILACTCLAWTVLVPAQYTTFRYWLGPAVAVWAYRLFTEQHRRGFALIALIAGFLATLLTSQEQSLPLLGGVFLFALLFLRRQWRSIAPGLVVLGVSAGVMFWFAYRNQWLDTLINIGTGAYSVPVGPAPVLLAVLPLLVIAACVFVEAIRLRSEGSVTTLLLCLSPFSLTAAFGRFDAVHVMGNTFAAALVGWMALARNEIWWRRLMPMYVVIIFVFPTQLPFSYRATWKLWRTPPYNLANDQIQAGLPTLYSPLGRVVEDSPMERLPFNYVTGRFYGTTDLITPRQAQQFIQQLRAQAQTPILMAPTGCVWGSNQRDLMRYNLGLYYPRPRRQVDDLHAICDELINYERISIPEWKVPAPFYLIRRRTTSP